MGCVERKSLDSVVGHVVVHFFQVCLLLLLGCQREAVLESHLFETILAQARYVGLARWLLFTPEDNRLALFSFPLLAKAFQMLYVRTSYRFAYRLGVFDGDDAACYGFLDHNSWLILALLQRLS